MKKNLCENICREKVWLEDKDSIPTNFPMPAERGVSHNEQATDVSYDPLRYLMSGDRRERRKFAHLRGERNRTMEAFTSPRGRFNWQAATVMDSSYLMVPYRRQADIKLVSS